MYVLLYVDTYGKPSYIEGSIEDINTELRKLWKNDDIDHEDWDWECNDAWKLLGIEDGCLTPVESANCYVVPQFEA